MTHQGQAGCFWVGAIVGQFDVVGAYSAGETSYGLARRHDICRNLIRAWVTEAEAGEFDDEVEAFNLLSDYEGKIAALERLVGRQDYGWAPKRNALNMVVRHRAAA